VATSTMGNLTVFATAPPGEPDPTALPYQDFRVRQAQIRLFDRSGEPDSDASDMYVLDVFGVSASVRLRQPGTGEQPELYVHIDNDSHQSVDLVVEVDNRGETRYQL
jgi:hypothetical protein